MIRGNELTVLALLVSLAVSDLRSEASDFIYATDASLAKGAICRAPVNVDFAQFLWRISRSKGAYHRLMTPLQTISKRLGLLEELGPDTPTSVPRPVAFCYDFLEVFSGASTVSRALDALGFVVGPPIDLSISEEYNMEWVRVVSWISFMLAAKRLCSVMCEPPCIYLIFYHEAAPASFTSLPLWLLSKESTDLSWKPSAVSVPPKPSCGLDQWCLCYFGIAL